MGLPEDFVEKWRAKAEGCTYFGIPVEELSREELTAALVQTAEQMAAMREAHAREVSLLSDIRNLRGNR